VSDADQARIAVAFARAARWISAAGIVFAAVVLAGLLIGRPVHTIAAVILSVAVAAGVPLVYLALRIEFDRSIFEDAAEAGDPVAYYAAFDQSRAELGLGGAGPARPATERVKGLIGLVRRTAFLFAVQVIFALLGYWVARWLS